MSQSYKATRSPAWNYGGDKWKLSRSKIDLFLECPRCFYLDNKLGVKRVQGPPFLLNSAVDHQLKQEFDSYREKQVPHPYQVQFHIDAIPAKHEQLNTWREVFQGVQFFHPKTQFLVTGAIDDLWMNSANEYIVVDYKATAKDAPIKNLDETSRFHDGYKRQMEVYQWLLRQNGLRVSDTGYFVYCTARRNQTTFNNVLEFDAELIPYTGKDTWVENVLLKIHACLEDERVPKAGAECEYCRYRETAGRELQERTRHSIEKKKEGSPKKTGVETGSLF